MHFATYLVTTVALASSGFAQYNYGSGNTASTSTSASTTATTSAAVASATSSGSVTVIPVKVSNKNGSLTFSPNDIKAPVGSMIQFQFYPKNHSVVQSTFDNPCVPINNIIPNVTGLFSGFIPIAPNATVRPVFTIPITDAKPIWFYCSQAKHCQAGMVGVINAPAANKSRTLETYRQGAQKAVDSLSPNGGAVSSAVVGTSTSTSTSTVVGTAATVTSVVVPTAKTSVDGGATATTSSRVATATGGATVAARGGMAGLGMGLVGLVVAVAL